MNSRVHLEKGSRRAARRWLGTLVGTVLFAAIVPAEAYSLYEWSRVTGYLGNHEVAANSFSNVLRMIEKAKPKVDALGASGLCESGCLCRQE